MVLKTFLATLTKYKAMLKQWYQGTGGDSGMTLMFQEWSSKKFNKYDVDSTVYDHSDIKSRPSI